MERNSGDTILNSSFYYDANGNVSSQTDFLGHTASYACELALTGWQEKRRVVVLRRPLMGEVVVEDEDDGQQVLAFVEADRKAGKGITGYEYAVLVTNTDYDVLSLAQLYRDRADAENAFDELKNQWGWGGFTTHDLHRCQLAARGVALAYNWWSLFVRLANPEAR